MIDKYIRQIMEEFHPYHEHKRLTYEDGLLLIAMLKLYEVTNEEDYLAFVDDYLDRHVDELGNIVNYKLDEYNIDNILSGNALLQTYILTGKAKYRRASDLLRSQLFSHPRTDSGGFWHKLRYPYQIWLDGLYMGQIFYLHYGLEFNEQDIFPDVFSQCINVRKYLFDNDKKLYFHAYDEKKVMQWANPESGRSPNVWSRSVGWLAMAFVEVSELFLGFDKKKSKVIVEMLEELLSGMLAHRDQESKMWYQIVNKPSLEGNYLETSGSAMLAYAMLKGSRLDLIDKKYREQGLETILGIEKTYLSEVNGKFCLGGTCKVAGLDNEKRDGSDAYYLSEPIAVNEIKGVGPYLFCHSEIKRLKR
ncbi:MAG: glycoside hydrolase family 88 protein [Bacilli bacterium]|nr:glycoside hydrolase family 88 protein [Bacilli bacterium]MBN2697081.1 glycoside hydrolase family 88 protein [Bacilli bacterium]